VHPFDTDNLARALYPFQLKPSDGLILNIDHQVTGVGGTPVPTLEKYRVLPHPYSHTIRLRPVTESQITALHLSRRKVAE
jgi:beta-galactosidase